jgi:polysaccharide export outer membrane protein
VIYVERAPAFYVYGEVNRPGSYRLERGMTRRHALAHGDGPTQCGSERNLRVHRRGADSQVHVIANPRLDEPVKPEDVLHVGESIF